MLRMTVHRACLWATLASLAIAMSATGSTAFGQDKPKDVKPAAVPQKKFRGRLPAHYRTVVDQKQREAIYKIQGEYWAQIQALRAKLAALRKERNSKIAAVLTPEQRKKVQEARKAAKKKREAAKIDNKKAGPDPPH